MHSFYVWFLALGIFKNPTGSVKAQLDMLHSIFFYCMKYICDQEVFFLVLLCPKESSWNLEPNTQYIMEVSFAKTLLWEICQAKQKKPPNQYMKVCIIMRKVSWIYNTFNKMLIL